MEERITRFYELNANPWFPVMNWVLDELRSAPENQHMHATEGWCFYGFSRKLLQNGYRRKIRYRRWNMRELQERCAVSRNG